VHRTALKPNQAANEKLRKNKANRLRYKGKRPLEDDIQSGPIDEEEEAAELPPPAKYARIDESTTETTVPGFAASDGHALMQEIADELKVPLESILLSLRIWMEGGSSLVESHIERFLPIGGITDEPLVTYAGYRLLAIIFAAFPRSKVAKNRFEFAGSDTLPPEPEKDPPGLIVDWLCAELTVLLAYGHEGDRHSFPQHFMRVDESIKGIYKHRLDRPTTDALTAMLKLLRPAADVDLNRHTLKSIRKYAEREGMPFHTLYIDGLLLAEAIKREDDDAVAAIVEQLPAVIEYVQDAMSGMTAAHTRILGVVLDIVREAHEQRIMPADHVDVFVGLLAHNIVRIQAPKHCAPESLVELLATLIVIVTMDHTRHDDVASASVTYGTLCTQLYANKMMPIARPFIDRLLLVAA